MSASRLMTWKLCSWREWKPSAVASQRSSRYCAGRRSANSAQRRGRFQTLTPSRRKAAALRIVAGSSDSPARMRRSNSSAGAGAPLDSRLAEAPGESFSGCHRYVFEEGENSRINWRAVSTSVGLPMMRTARLRRRRRRKNARRQMIRKRAKNRLAAAKIPRAKR